MASRLKTHFIPVWKEAPFLRLLLPLIPGIICQWYYPLSISTLVILSGTILVLLLFIYLRKENQLFHYFFGSCIFLLLFTIGCWFVLLKDGSGWKHHVAKHYYPGETVIATLQEPLVTKSNAYKAIASLQLIDSSGNLVQVSGKIICYLAKDLDLPLPAYGSNILFKKTLVPIKNAGNPGEFDYKSYAAFNGWFYQVFLTKGDYVVAPVKTYNRFRLWLFIARDFVITRFRQYIPGKVEAGLAEALLVGYREDLDKSIIEQYANTGVIHLIAISGMHLGMIYGLLLVLLKPLGTKKYGKIINAFIIIVILWFFSLLTGAAPSITRAAIMFTVIVAGNTFSKKAGIYNSLSVAAFILLLADPFHLWNVGFQLSFAALLSIAVFGKPITGLLHPGPVILQRLWQLIAVTLAAQVFTLPLVLYHFHQFPLSFLIANLVAVPLGSIILNLLIILLCLTPLPHLASLLGGFIGWLVMVMNQYIGYVSVIPFSRLDQVNFSLVQALLLILLIMAVCWWIMRKSGNAFITALGVVILMFIIRNVQHYEMAMQKKLVVYNLPKNTGIDIIHGRHCSFFGDAVLINNKRLQAFYLLPSRVAFGTSFYKSSILCDSSFTKLRFGNQSMIILDKSVDLKSSLNQEADYLLINKNCKTKPVELLSRLRCRTVILDGTNSYHRITQWKNAADSLHLRLHSVQEQGAFVQNF